MKPNFYKSVALSVLLAGSFSSIAQAGKSNANYELRAFYGDKKDNNVVVIDVKRMQLIAKVPTEGLTPYPVDRAGYLDKVYAITRGSFSMDVIDAETLENIGLIPLTHKPRSGESFNSRLGLAIVAGADQPITSVIDVMNDSVAAVTIEEQGAPLYSDYGGGNASGHPAWLSKDRFVVIDRARRLIQLWGIDKVQDPESLDYSWELTQLDTLNTPTSVHHILSRNTSKLPRYEKRTFYALSEGKQAADETEGAIQPAILKLRLTGNDQLIFEDKIDLPGDAAEMGAHHADFHPDGQHIYVGSTEGHLFVVDSVSKEIVTTIETGLGTGHTRFVSAKDLAIVTNHKDTFVTVINTATHTKIKDITVSGVQQNGEILQSHTNYVSPDSMYYYAFASDNGVFFEIDLHKLKKTKREVVTGGVPVQGSFINWDDFSHTAASSSTGM
ncbi:MAG: hypothetical protein GQ582_05800 [Methyloprofundus sp.]|nr:hypothetical protein [Methyloprofundus sp.]